MEEDSFFFFKYLVIYIQALASVIGLSFLEVFICLCNIHLCKKKLLKIE